MSFKHHDEARTDAVVALLAWLKNSPESRAVLIDDLYGKYRLVLWPGSGGGEDKMLTLKETLAAVAGSYWSGEIWLVTPETSKLDLQVYKGAWEEGRAHPDQPRLRILDRVRNRVAWFREIGDPPWEVQVGAKHKRPPIILFYSFKGGVGRTTALASFALRRASAGDRVVVIDADLDAPGLGPFFQGDKDESRKGSQSEDVLVVREGDGDEDKEGEAGNRAGLQWGVVDCLLERPTPDEVDLSDYYFSVRNEPVIPGNGEILVFPSGRIDGNYLAKLARLDFDPPPKGTTSPWIQLLQRARQELCPDWILVDSRAGLGEPAGLLLAGMAHLHVLFGTASEQSWQGIRLILERIGSERVRQDKPQAECVLVQAMVPEFHDAAVDAQASFLARAENEFESHYYAENPVDPEDDSMWFIRDKPAKDAPHQPVYLSYKQKLAHFRRLEHVVPELLGDEYRKLGERIEGRFLEDTE